MNNSINNLSPLDGRYSQKVSEITQLFSEKALIHKRFIIEIEWLLFVLNESFYKTIKISKKDIIKIIKFKNNFDDSYAKKIKNIESKTNHDVKAVEYFINDFFNKNKLKKFIPYVHLGLTSEDVNSLSYALMISEAKDITINSIKLLNKEIKSLSLKYKRISFLARTHGQPASPSTIGKEMLVFHKRLERQIDQLTHIKPMAKWGGATGNYHTIYIANRKRDPIKLATKFIKKFKVEHNVITTQIEPHDWIAETCHALIRVNNIINDLNNDFWLYISNDIFILKANKYEIGSSTMPHKVNPIDFENSEGNIGLANSMLNFFAVKLPISRLQRDLSDSTALRNIGVAFGYSLVAYKSTIKGLQKVATNNKKIKEELNNNWVVLSEAVQTIMRLENIDNAYEKLKELTRGKNLNQEKYLRFIETLNISTKNKEYLMKLKPENYIGIASDLK
ncbi:MAG: adenylosuccinate lyase [Flavobacteriaceae bacterium]|nr:adenylosuccinate lyase [Flavobacteriaceae bacterium]